MDEYKPVTGELRRRGYLTEANIEVDGAVTFAKVYFGTKDFRDLCDNIDAVHAELERDFDRLKAERDSMAAALDAAQGEHAYAPESHYMLLPKDADGVPIHVGDVMEWIDPNGEFSLVCTVEAVSVDSFITWSTESGRFMQKDAKAYRHYHKPTVENVLKDFIDAWAEWKDGAAMMNPVETFADKLRLADEKEQQ